MIDPRIMRLGPSQEDETRWADEARARRERRIDAALARKASGGTLPDGMAQRSDGAIWAPRPHPDLSNFGRRAYFAGYSDGFHGYPFGAGDDGTIGAFSDYRPGFADGRSDAEDR